MIVFGQDTLVTAVDLTAPWVIGAGAAGATSPAGGYFGEVGSEIVISFASFLYDLQRLNGEIDNRVSVGLLFEEGAHMQVYILVFPPE
jgi:hypothetical protein